MIRDTPTLAASLLVIACFSCLACAGPGGGRLLVEEGFESGAYTFRVSGNAPEVVRVPDARAGDYVLRSTLNGSSEIKKRTEAAFNEDATNFDVGKEYWLGISIKLGEDFRDPADFNDRSMLMQWHYRDWLHPEVRDAQPLLLRFVDGRVHVENEVLQTYMASVPPAYGEWVDWVFHVKLDNQDGIIRVWRNGEMIVDWTGDNHQVEKHEGAYLKFGLYSSQYAKHPPGIEFNRTVYHDEIRMAGADGSYEAVAPRGEQASID